MDYARSLCAALFFSGLVLALPANMPPTAAQETTPPEHLPLIPRSSPYQPIPDYMIGRFELAAYNSPIEETQEGFPPFKIKDPLSYLGQVIEFDRDGYTFMGYRCHYDYMRWRNSPSNGPGKAYTPEPDQLPPEYRDIRYTVKYWLQTSCSDLYRKPEPGHISIPDTLKPFFRPHFDFYYPTNHVIEVHFASVQSYFLRKLDITDEERQEVAQHPFLAIPKQAIGTYEVAGHKRYTYRGIQQGISFSSKQIKTLIGAKVEITADAMIINDTVKHNWLDISDDDRKVADSFGDTVGGYAPEYLPEGFKVNSVMRHLVTASEGKIDFDDCIISIPGKSLMIQPGHKSVLYFLYFPDTSDGFLLRRIDKDQD